MTMEGRWNIKSREPKTATEFFDGPADTERIYDKTHKRNHHRVHHDNDMAIT